MKAFLPLVITPTVFGWWHGGHQITGWIARKTLIDHGRQDVVDMIERILSLDPDNYPYHTTFLTAPTWMDDIRYWPETPPSNNPMVRDLIETWNWNHLMSIPIEVGCSIAVNGSCSTTTDVESYLADTSLNHINSILRPAFNHLAPYPDSIRQPGSGRLWSLELDLKFIFHLIGDAHMPFHVSAAWYNGLWECPKSCIWHFCDRCEKKSEEEGGEFGKRYLTIHEHGAWGAFIFIEYAADVDPKNIPPAVDLHALWDALGGFARERSNEGPDELKIQLAEELMREWPLARTKELGFRTWEDNWTLEEDVYPEAFVVASQGTLLDGSRDDDQPWYGYLDVDPGKHVCFEILQCLGAGCGVNCDAFDSQEECIDENRNFCMRHRSYLITEAYRQYIERASKRLVALAGYRLADALRRVVDGLKSPLMSDIENRHVGACEEDRDNAEIGKDDDSARIFTYRDATFLANQF